MDTKKIILWVVIIGGAIALLYFFVLKPRRTGTVPGGNQAVCTSQVKLSENQAIDMSKRVADLLEGDAVQKQEGERLKQQMTCGGWMYVGYGSATRMAA